MGKDKATDWSKTPMRTREYFGYGAGILGYQFQNNIMNNYLLIFFNSVLGIPLIAAGTITVACRFVDACTDLFFGTLGDRTKSKWGSYRPWYIACAVPACFFFWLLFTRPSFIPAGTTTALIYAYVIYLVFGSVFTTVMQTSYGAFGTIATTRPEERNKMVLFRQMGVNISNLGSSIVPLLLLAFGSGDATSPRALSGVALVAAVIGVVLYLFCGITIKERVALSKNKKVPLKESFQVFKGNWTFLGVMIMQVFATLAIAMYGGMITYYFIYFKNNAALITPSQVAGVVVAMVINVAFLPVLIKRLPRKKLYLLSVGVTTVFYAVGYLLSGTDMGGYFMFIGFQVGVLLTLACVYATLPDAVDYGEWKSGIVAPGIMNTVITFVQKSTTGIGTLAISIILTYAGFDATLGANQAEFTNQIIRITTAAGPVFFWAVSAIGLLFLRIGPDKMNEIRGELKIRRTAAADEASES